MFLVILGYYEVLNTMVETSILKETKLAGITIVSKLIQSLKVQRKIVVTLSGIVID